MKTLILCRHAKSDWPAGVSDVNRPLKERGIRDANFISGLLRDQGFQPDLILSSIANRAYSTAEIFKANLGYQPDIVRKEKLYLASVRTIQEVIKTVPDDQEKIMIFGHNPTMESAVQWLLQSATTFEMPTCGTACFEYNDYSWSRFNEYKVNMRWYLIPRLARKTS